MDTKPHLPLTSKGKLLSTLTKPGWRRFWVLPDRPAILVIASVAIIFGIILLSLLAHHPAFADAGGNPTSTPRPTATATFTPTFTATNPPPPTLSPRPDQSQVTPPATVQTDSEAKALETATSLTLEQISGTLQAQTVQPAPSRPVIGWYVLILLVVSAAVVVVVLLGLIRQSKQNPPENKDE